MQNSETILNNEIHVIYSTVYVQTVKVALAVCDFVHELMTPHYCGHFVCIIAPL